MRPAPSRKFFFIILGALALGYMIYDYGVASIVRDIQNAGYFTFVLVLTFVPTLVCYSGAWLLVTEFENEGPSWFEKLVTFIKMTAASIAWNNLTPFLKVAGEPVKIFMLEKYVSREKALVSTIVYNVIHILATLASFIIVAFSLPFVFATPADVTSGCYLVGGIASCIFTFLMALPYLSSHFSRFFQRIFPAGFESKTVVRLRWALNKTFHSFRVHSFRVSMAFILEVFARFVEGLTFYLAFSLLKHPIPAVNAAFLDVGRTLVDTIFFFIPYQVGGREQGVFFLLKEIFKQGTDGYLTAVFMYRFVEIVWVVIGYYFWIRSKSFSKQSI